MRKTNPDGNPWGLTAHQTRALTLMCTLGSQAQAAKALGITQNTMRGMLKLIAKRMPEYPSSTARYIAWDRWRLRTSVDDAAAAVVAAHKAGTELQLPMHILEAAIESARMQEVKINA